MAKQFFDVTVSLATLILLSPLLLIIATAIAVTDGLPVLFRQQRIGRDFQTFTLLKFRTMRDSENGSPITSEGDPRVTRLGGFLRSTKLDETPQLFNVVKGDMSLVGPRPEVAKYVEEFREEFSVLLQMRPGVTGAASLEYRNESEILGQSDNPLRTYEDEVLPAKIAIEKAYVANNSLSGDIRILAETVITSLRK